MKLIKFIGNSCPSCDRLDIILNNAFPEAVEKMEKINTSAAVGAEMDLVIEHGVMTTPTLLLLDGEGKEVERYSGYNTPQVAGIVGKFMEG